MRLMRSFIDRVKHTRREDTIFDSMLYMGAYWEGKAKFLPTSSSIEVFVEGAVDDNLEVQHEFFEDLCREWPTIREGIGKALRDRWLKRNPEIPTDPIWEWFTIASVRIPKGSIDTATWDISFYRRSDPENACFNVLMKGREPVQVVLDD